MLKEKDKQLEQLYVERAHCIDATDEEDQELDLEEDPPHFSMWQKIKYVAISICSQCI